MARSGFQIDDRTRVQIIGGDKFDSITREQARAFRHATGSQGLAIIDGQAGTGKSYTLAAIQFSACACAFNSSTRRRLRANSHPETAACCAARRLRRMRRQW